MTISQFIGTAQYDTHGGVIRSGDRVIANVRSWGAICNLFTKDGKVDMAAAEAFHDELGQFIAEAINEKLGEGKQ